MGSLKGANRDNCELRFFASLSVGEHVFKFGKFLSARGIFWERQVVGFILDDPSCGEMLRACVKTARKKRHLTRTLLWTATRYERDDASASACCSLQGRTLCVCETVELCLMCVVVLVKCISFMREGSYM